MMSIRRLAIAVLAAAAVFAAVTLWALEGGEVAILRTDAADGAYTETRVWVADADGAAWIEAATPERGWYRVLASNATVVLVRDGAAVTYDATPQPGAAGHTRIRALLRAKYGWADAWVGMLQDTSRSIAVRLTPMRTTGEAGP
jgi:hypothetical protein